MKEKIGVIARYTGLAAHTIKYYENMGLIDNVRMNSRITGIMN